MNIENKKLICEYCRKSLDDPRIPRGLFINYWLCRKCFNLVEFDKKNKS